MNKIYRKSVSIKVAFFSAGKNNDVVLQKRSRGNSEIVWQKKGEEKPNFFRKIIRPIVKRAYHLSKPILKPIFSRLRQYFMGSLQRELEDNKEQFKRSMNVLERKIDHLLQEVVKLQSAIRAKDEKFTNN